MQYIEPTIVIKSPINKSELVNNSNDPPNFTERTADS